MKDFLSVFSSNILTINYMNAKNIIIGGGFLFFIISSCGNKQKTDEKDIQEYPTMITHTQDTAVFVSYPTVIKGQEDIDIKPRLEGLIEDIYVDEGAVVKKGQKLFKINSPQTVQLLTNAQQTLVSAQAQVNTAQIDVERMSGLAAKGIISDVQLKLYQNAYQSALASEQQAKAQVANAQATSSWMTVTSPVDGRVGTINYRLGSLVNTSTTLTTVANIENIYAYFSLNEKTLMDLFNTLNGHTDAEKIKQIPPVTLILADETVYPEKGRVETISGVINTSTGSANFRARFSNQSGILRSGTSGRVQIPQELKNVIVIPQKATFDIQNKTLVFVTQGDSILQKTIDIVPIPGGASYAVTKGINSGDRIVIDGVATLKNGQKINFK